MSEEIGSLVVNIGMDNTGFQNGVSKLNRQLRVVQSEFRAASENLGNFGESTDRLRLKSDSLNRQMEIQREKVQALQGAYERSVNATGEESRASQELEIRLNQARASLNRMANELHTVTEQINVQENGWNQLSKKLESVGESFSELGEKMTSAGETMSEKVTAPILAAGAASVVFAGDFEESGNKVSTIADTTVMSMEEINKGVLKMSDDLGISATELNNTLYQTLSATGDTSNALSYVEVASKAAIGGFTDTTTAVDGLTTVLNAYGQKGTKAMKDISDQMIVAQNYGKTTFGDMAANLGNVIPITASLNVGTKELFASIATLTKNGIGTAEAITGIKAALSNVIKPSKEASDMASSLGIEFNSAHLKSVGWSKFLGEVSEKTGGNTEKMAKLFGSVEALNSVTVLATTGSKDFAGALKAMEQSAGATQAAFEKMDNGAKDNLEDTLNKLKNVGITIGQELLPYVNKFLDKVSNMLDEFNELDEGSKKVIITIGGICAAIGPALMLIGKITSAVGSASLILSKLTGALGTTAVASASEVVALDGAAVATTGFASAISAALIPLAPYAIALGAIVFTGYEIHKSLNERATPAVKSLSDQVAESEKISKNSFDTMQNKVGTCTQNIEKDIDKISKSTAKSVDAYMKMDNDIGNSLLSFKLKHTVVTKEISDNLVNSFVKMGQKIKDSEDKRYKETLDNTKKLLEKSKALNEEEEKQIFENLKKTNEDKKKEIDAYTKKINEIAKKASSEKRELNKSEQQEINSIQNKMRENAIVTLSKNQVEAKAVMEIMKRDAVNITTQQVSEIIKNSKKQKDDTIKNAKEEYKDRVAEIIKLRDESKVISKDQADKLINEAKRQKDESVKKAKETYKEVIDTAKKQASEHLKHVNLETGEIKTKWQEFESSISQTCKNIKTEITTKTKEGLDFMKKEYDTAKQKASETWKDIESSISESLSKVNSKIQDAIDKIKEWNLTEVKEKVFSIVEKIQRAFSSGGGGGSSFVTSTNTSSSTSSGKSSSKVGKNAQGTDYWGGGLTWAGEEGTELVITPRGESFLTTDTATLYSFEEGTKIFSNPQTMDILSGSGLSKLDNINAYHNQSKIDYDKLGRAVSKYIKPSITQHNNFYSPKALEPSETSRQNRKVLRQLGLSM